MAWVDMQRSKFNLEVWTFLSQKTKIDLEELNPINRISEL
jgi:hypothetical protein